MMAKQKFNFKSLVATMHTEAQTQSKAVDVLSQRYSIDNFGNFVASLCGQEYDKGQVGNIIVAEEFKGVKSIKRVFEYEEEETLDILVAIAVELDTNSFVGSQRAYQRGVVSHILSKSRDWDKAIVAFHTEGEPAWRLSYIKLDAVRETDLVTPLYRWSFLVGESEPCRTIKEKASDLIDAFTSKSPSIEQIEAVFTSVNAVTDIFYTRFMECYTNLKQATIAKYNGQYTFSIERTLKNIMGQTVALFFLQKCGFLGVKEGELWGTGDHYYVTKRVAEYKGKNIYKDVFAPLMSALAGDTKLEGENIPVLNGGLFTVIETFKDGQPFDIPTDLFISFVNMLSEFNFTVSESDQFDKDVAVDPEMLGRIYESFISTEDEDGRNTKKNTGAVYTPSTIVEYMVQEALAEWLVKQVDGLQKEDIDELLSIHELNFELLTTLGIQEQVKDKGFTKSLKAIDEALTRITVLEPSVGSGAFLVGALLEIVKLRHNIGVILYFLREITTDQFEENYAMYKLKLNTVLTSLYGVDVNAGAVDIARLRIWLSLIVDMKQPSQLPNLDFRITVGNSLIDRVGNKLLFPPEANLDLTEFNRLKQEFLTKEHGSKFETRDKITREIITLLSNIEDYGETISFAVDLENGQRLYLKDITSQDELDLLFRYVFSYDLMFGEVMEKGGFDLIVGNPPYVRGNRLSDIIDVLASIFEVYSGIADLYCYFYEQGNKLLKPNGVLTFITSNKWLTSRYGKPLRDYLTTKTELLLLLDFKTNHVFKGTGVDAEITMFRKPIDLASLSTGNFVYCDAEGYQFND